MIIFRNAQVVSSTLDRFLHKQERNTFMASIEGKGQTARTSFSSKQINHYKALLNKSCTNFSFADFSWILHDSKNHWKWNGFADRRISRIPQGSGWQACPRLRVWICPHPWSPSWQPHRWWKLDWTYWKFSQQGKTFSLLVFQRVLFWACHVQTS